MIRKLDSYLYRRWRAHGATAQQVAASLRRDGQPIAAAAICLSRVFARTELWAGRIVCADYLPLRRQYADPRGAYIHLYQRGVERSDLSHIVRYVYELNNSRAKSVMLRAEQALGHDVQQSVAAAIERWDDPESPGIPDNPEVAPDI